MTGKQLRRLQNEEDLNKKNSAESWMSIDKNFSQHFYLLQLKFKILVAIVNMTNTNSNKQHNN